MLQHRERARVCNGGFGDGPGGLTNWAVQASPAVSVEAFQPRDSGCRPPWALGKRRGHLIGSGVGGRCEHQLLEDNLVDGAELDARSTLLSHDAERNHRGPGRPTSARIRRPRRVGQLRLAWVMLNETEILALVVPLVLGPLALYWVIRLAVRDAMKEAQRR